MLNEYKNKLKKAFEELKNPKTFYKQIPNILTSTRIISPFIIIPLALTGNVIAAIIAASIIASTDFFDGLIARKLNITSELGRELDAISDKFFAISLVVPLVIQTPIFLINIVFESIIGISNLRAKLKKTNPKTIFVGKVKTFALSLSIIIGYLSMFVSLNPMILNSFIAITSVLQTITASSYLKINFENEMKLHMKDDNLRTTNELENENSKEKEITKEIDKSNDTIFETKQITNEINNQKQKVLKKTLKKPRI